jgi:methionine-rich copper-binding protein CopC
MQLLNSPHGNRFATLLALTGFLASLCGAHAAPTITSTVPANGATGVSTTTTIVFTFSEAMDTDATSAFFYDGAFNVYTTTDTWSAGQTVLTCTPDSAFPVNTVINWAVSGENPTGDPLGGIPIGSFTTGTGTGGGGGSGTNATTTFAVGKSHHYNQTSSGAPTLDPLTPYGFIGMTSLSSNRTANSVTLTMPTAAVSSLLRLPPPQAEIFLLTAIDTNLSALDATYPAGNYSFLVQATASNQTVVVNLPTTNSMPQPGAPHLTNYLAAQAVNPNQPFVLGWDAFPGGTAADYIDVDIGDDFGSPDPGLPGALPGTARTFNIPAGTLQPNFIYESRIGFFRHVGTTNASYAADAYRATYTEFMLVTTSGSATGPLILTNAAYAPGSFSFNVLCSPGQTVTVEYRTNLTSGLWQTLLTTNSPGNLFRAVAPQAATNPFLFFRARNGS